MPQRNGLGDLEREVMAQLWAAAGPLTVRQVHEALNRDRDLAYTTVMTVLDRLAKKDVVTRQKADRAYLYAAAQSREEMTASVMLDALTTSGDQDAALAYFVGQLPPEALAAAIEAAQKR
jgi:predicted transcriptional regulator